MYSSAVGRKHTKDKQSSSPLVDFCDLFQLDISQSDVTKSSPQPEVALLFPAAHQQGGPLRAFLLTSAHKKGMRLHPKYLERGPGAGKKTQVLGTSVHTPHANTRASCQGDPPLQVLWINPKLWVSVYELL